MDNLFGEQLFAARPLTREEEQLLIDKDEHHLMESPRDLDENTEIIEGDIVLFIGMKRAAVRKSET